MKTGGVRAVSHIQAQEENRKSYNFITLLLVSGKELLWRDAWHRKLSLPSLCINNNTCGEVIFKVLFLLPLATPSPPSSLPYTIIAIITTKWAAMSLEKRRPCKAAFETFYRQLTSWRIITDSRGTARSAYQFPYITIWFHSHSPRCSLTLSLLLLWII